MSCILLLSDDVGRSRILARQHAGIGNWVVLDLFGGQFTPMRPAAIVSDIKRVTSEAVDRLRKALDVFRKAGVPYCWLLHFDTDKERFQALALGADHALDLRSLPRLLRTVVGDPAPEKTGEPASAEALAGEARTLLAEMFSPAAEVTPRLVDTGTTHVVRAIGETSIRDWLEVVWKFDDATHQHCLLVAGLAAAFASTLGFCERDCHRLTKAALLHDIGKAAVPAEILGKKGPLTDAERGTMRLHPVDGHAMLAERGFEPEMLQVVRSHHELLDGSGYPDGLKGDEIPDLVRLVTICDIYAALIERRPYKAPLSMERAYAILEEMSGRLDPDLVRAFRPIACAFETGGIGRAAA